MTPSDGMPPIWLLPDTASVTVPVTAEPAGAASRPLTTRSEASRPWTGLPTAVFLVFTAETNSIESGVPAGTTIGWGGGGGCWGCAAATLAGGAALAALACAADLLAAAADAAADCCADSALRRASSASISCCLTAASRSASSCSFAASASACCAAASLAASCWAVISVDLRSRINRRRRGTLAAAGERQGGEDGQADEGGVGLRAGQLHGQGLISRKCGRGGLYVIRTAPGAEVPRLQPTS